MSKQIFNKKLLIRIDHATMLMVRDFAVKEKTSMSEVVRRLIRKFVK